MELNEKDERITVLSKDIENEKQRQRSNDKAHMMLQSMFPMMKEYFNTSNTNSSIDSVSLRMVIVLCLLFSRPVLFARQDPPLVLGGLRGLWQWFGCSCHWSRYVPKPSRLHRDGPRWRPLAQVLDTDEGSLQVEQWGTHERRRDDLEESEELGLLR
jgi:hypothetical protein